MVSTHQLVMLFSSIMPINSRLPCMHKGVVIFKIDPEKQYVALCLFKAVYTLTVSLRCVPLFPCNAATQTMILFFVLWLYP